MIDFDLQTRRAATMRRGLLTMAATVTVAAAIGFAGAAWAANDKPIVIVRDMDFGSLDPARGYCDTCQIVFKAMYDTLIHLNQETKFEPRIAKSWDVSEDQTVFTFHLDPKATFSDGTPVEAKDVKWSFSGCTI
jgi:peptide/nickel transport system substrate-binding protein